MEPEVTPTEQPVKKQSRRRLYILISILAVLLVALFASILLTKPSSETINQEQETDSNPVSFTEQINTEYRLVNEDDFYKTSITNFQTEHCDINIPTETTSYTYKFDPQYVMHVSRNVDKYADYDEHSKESYDLVKSILDDKISIDDLAEQERIYITALFSRYCGGVQNVPIVYLERIEYFGTDSAYVIVQLGSTQSVTDSQYMPLYISIISRIGNEYTFSSVPRAGLAVNPNPISYINDPTMYVHITSKNSLAACEVLGDEPMKYIDIDNPECLINAFQQDLDKEILDRLVDAWLEKFKLK